MFKIRDINSLEGNLLLFGITCQRYCYCSILILFFAVSSDCGARITNPILSYDVSFVLFVGNLLLE